MRFWYLERENKMQMLYNSNAYIGTGSTAWQSPVKTAGCYFHVTFHPPWSVKPSRSMTANKLAWKHEFASFLIRAAVQRQHPIVYSRSATAAAASGEGARVWRPEESVCPGTEKNRGGTGVASYSASGSRNIPSFTTHACWLWFAYGKWHCTLLTVIVAIMYYIGLLLLFAVV